MAEPEMYPLTDNPTYSEEFDTFAELCEQVESTIEGLNFIVSWLVVPEGDPLLDEGEPPTFHVLMFMPRKTASTEFYTHQFDPAEVETWLGGYVRERTMRWYGWAEQEARS